MHILILNQTFWPDIAATAQHMWDLAKHLDEAGHRVTVVTSRQMYGTDKLIERDHERVGNIGIHRLRGTAFGKGNIVGRMLDFASFYFVAFEALLRLEKPDVVVSLTSPPMVSALPAALKGLSGNYRLIYYVMDLYPEVIEAHGMMGRGHPVYRVLSAVTRFTIRQSDAVVALGHDMKRLIETRYPRAIASEKIQIVQPWGDAAALSPLAKSENALARELGLDQTFNVVYSGNLGLPHDVETLEGAIEATGDDAGLRWLFIGGGKRLEALKKKAGERAWRNVQFLPYFPRERLRESLSLADAHLVTQLPAFTGIVVPSKLFGIMAVGRPTLYVGPSETECARVIRESDAGVLVPNGDVSGLLGGIERLRNNATIREAFGVNARRAFEERYNSKVLCAKIERLLSP